MRCILQCTLDMQWNLYFPTATFVIYIRILQVDTRLFELDISLVFTESASPKHTR